MLDGAARVDGADELTKEEQDKEEEERAKEEVKELEEINDDDDDDEEAKELEEELRCCCNTSMAETSFPAKLDVGKASIWEVISTPGVANLPCNRLSCVRFQNVKIWPIELYAKGLLAAMLEAKAK